MEEFDINCSISTVSRCIRRLKLTHKRVARVNCEQDEELRTLYLAKIADFTANQVIFVDESAANERTSDRKYGWSPRGTPYRVRSPGKRSTRWSILPAIGINGYLNFDIYHGSYNAERFNNFIQHLLTKMTPFPFPRPQSVLIMDNARIHVLVRLRKIL